MVQLSPADIRTTEILHWTGVHLFHFQGSSCSQKLRLFLNEKNVSYTRHHVDLSPRRQENYSPYFLGINPRGLVPTLVLDGVVHIESNDIMAVLEERFPDPTLFPKTPTESAELAESLAREDALHKDLRTITFRFLIPRFVGKRDPKLLKIFETEGSGTISGQPDPQRARELEFWRAYANHGISDSRVVASIRNFQAAFRDLEQRLQSRAFLGGTAPTVMDIAWFISIHRLYRAGYPLWDHPRLFQWYTGQAERPGWCQEIHGGLMDRIGSMLRFWHRLTGQSLVKILERTSAS